MSRRIFPLIILAVILFAGVLAYQYWVAVQQPALKSLLPDDAQVVAVGQEVYAEHCASCHGANLEGEPNWRERKPSGHLPAPPHDKTGHTWHHADDALFNLTKYGPQFVAGPEYESDMPAYDGILADDEIIAVLSYIKSTWPPRERAVQDEITRRMTPE